MTKRTTNDRRIIWKNKYQQVDLIKNRLHFKAISSELESNLTKSRIEINNDDEKF